MCLPHRLLSLVVILVTQALLDVMATDTGDTISRIVQKFANEGLGTGDMQDYITHTVNFDTETINEDTVEEIATRMSENLNHHIGLLTGVRNFMSSASDSDTSAYSTCCNSTCDGQSSIRGDEVNLENWCLLGDTLCSKHPPEEYLPVSVLNKFNDVYTRDDNLKYIYFGSDDGVLYNYPPIQTKTCNSYDPRFRSWYVETIAPEPKDVVIVMDVSTSMGNSAGSGDKTLLDFAEEAAIAVVDTLNPNDRVGVVKFSTDTDTPGDKDTDTDTCYNTTLAKANPTNKDYLTRFIAYYTNSEDKSYFSGALERAFKYFHNTPEQDNNGKRRDKVLLFLTDGLPSDDDSPESIYNTLSDLNGQLNNEVVVLTYLLSTTKKEDAALILNNMTTQIYSNSSLGSIRAGRFTHVSDPEKLKTEMATYYTFFKVATADSKPIFSVPFLDYFGTSSVQISMCLPVEAVRGSLKGGVVCMDQLVDDILSEITYFRKGDLAYAFIMDGMSRVLSHPLLKNPADITHDPVFFELGALEFGDGIEEIRQSMISGQMGQKNVISRRVVARGSLDTEGVNSEEVESTYYWHPVEGTSFSVCIVKKVNEIYQKIHWEGAYPSQFIYHINSITNPQDTCKYFAREALIDQGNVKFAPRSFLKPYVYVSGTEAASAKQGYEMYFTGEPIRNDWFRPEVRDHVAFSYKFEELMESRKTYGDYAVWRYFGTEAGVMRLYPGAEISSRYDPSLRTWYLRAMSSRHFYSISTPYIDAFGAGVVVTLSKAMLNPSENLAVGVMGVDFTMPYFYYLLTQDIADCSIYNCLVIDRSGFVVLNSKWFEPGAPEIKYIEGIHISSVEPEIAHDLASNEPVLVSSSCINMNNQKEQKFWKLALSASVDGGFRSKDWYEMHEIAETNIFLLIKKALPPQEKCYCPSPQNNIELCSSVRTYSCFCPCFIKTDVYSYCSGVFSLSVDGDPPCSPPVPSVDSTHLKVKESKIIKNLDTCRDYKCSQRTNGEQCIGVASCTWCDDIDSGVTTPYCATWGDCASGPLTDPFPDTTDEAPQDEPKKAEVWIIAVAVVGGLLAITAMIVVTICVVKRRAPRESLHKTGTIHNEYTGACGATGSSHSEAKLEMSNSPNQLGVEDDDVYQKLRESILELSFSPPPPPPHQQPGTSRTLPPYIQVTDTYISSVSPRAGSMGPTIIVSDHSERMGPKSMVTDQTDTTGSSVMVTDPTEPETAATMEQIRVPEGSNPTDTEEVYLKAASVLPKPDTAEQ